MALNSHLKYSYNHEMCACNMSWLQGCTCNLAACYPAPRNLRFYVYLSMFMTNLCALCRRVAVDAVEAQGVKMRRTQVDVDSAFANVF